MSHVVCLKAELQNIEAVKRACAELGLIFKENKKTIRWYGRWMNDYDAENAAYKLGITPQQYGKCDHAIEVPNCSYDIGLIRNPETGGYKLYFDFYGEGRKIQTALGENGERILQYSQTIAAEMLAESKGYLTTRFINPTTQQIELKVTGV